MRNFLLISTLLIGSVTPVTANEQTAGTVTISLTNEQASVLLETKKPSVFRDCTLYCAVWNIYGSCLSYALSCK